MVEVEATRKSQESDEEGESGPRRRDSRTPNESRAVTGDLGFPVRMGDLGHDFLPPFTLYYIINLITSPI